MTVCPGKLVLFACREWLPAKRTVGRMVGAAPPLVFTPFTVTAQAAKRLQQLWTPRHVAHATAARQVHQLQKQKGPANSQEGLKGTSCWLPVPGRHGAAPAYTDWCLWPQEAAPPPGHLLLPSGLCWKTLSTLKGRGGGTPASKLQSASPAPPSPWPSPPTTGGSSFLWRRLESPHPSTPQKCRTPDLTKPPPSCDGGNLQGAWQR